MRHGQTGVVRESSGEVESFLEGSHGDRLHVSNDAHDHHAVTPLCGTPLRSGGMERENVEKT